MIYPKLSDGTIDWCVMCKHEGRALFDGCCECEYPENSDDPPTKYEPKDMTNGDRIRSMSDEELADRFYFLRRDALRLEGFEGLIETRDEVLDWLKEASDETE